MLTIGSCSKLFEDEFYNLQDDSINSWRNIVKGNILLCGKESINYCIDNKLRNIEIKYEDNTPLMDSIFKNIQENCNTEFYMYINSDILLKEINDLKLFNILKKIREEIGENFLCIGERYELLRKNILLDKKVDFKNIENNAKKYGVNSGAFAIDYFLLPRDLQINFPTLYLGIPGADNFIIQYCKENNIPIIDISNVLLAVHADHHCRGKGGWLKSWYGEKSKINRSYIKGHIHSLDDADYIVDIEGNLIKGGKIKRYTDIEMAITNRLEMFRDAIEEEKYMDAVDHWNLVCMRDPKKKYVSEEDKKLFSEVIEKLSILPIEFMMEVKSNIKDYIEILKKLNILWRLHVIDNLKNEKISEYLDNLKKEFSKNIIIYRKLNWKNRTEMYNKVIQNMPNKALLFLLDDIYTTYYIEDIRKIFKYNKEKNSVENSLGKFVYRYEPGYKWSEDEVPILLDTEDNEV